MTKQLQDLYSAKLQSSGLTLKDAKTLQMTPLAAPQVAALQLPPFMGLRIPYFTLSGKKTEFYRIRYLESTKQGFKALTKAKELRYIQPPDSINELYLPPIVDWAKIASKPAAPIVVTEGEFKAAAACKAGFYTIGLGGVWNFRSATINQALLDDFKAIDWKGRVVVILFDSDAATNPKVMKAENELARQLTKEGADVRIGRMHKTNDSNKMGIDDLLVANGKEALRKILDAALPFAPCEELFKLNTEVVYVRNPGLVLRLDNLQRMSPRAFIDHAYSTRIYTEQVVSEGKKGTSTKLVEKCAPKEWMKWPVRVEVERVTYSPGKDRLVNNCLNVWPGWGCEPVPGDVEMWHELLEYIFKGKEEQCDWLEDWLAYPIQCPGTKMFCAVNMWSLYHGTGKSLLGYTMKKIYGKNFTEIKDSNLQESHNEWAENKQFVMGDDITYTDKRGIADRLKSMITQQELRLNPKFIPSYTVEDCINYYFTSNHPDSLFVEDNDRRYFIWEIKGRPKEREFYVRYIKWLNNGGAEALFAYFLGLDLTLFDPAAPAPMTESKAEMISIGKSDLASWVANLRENPDTVLKVDTTEFKHKLWRSEDLLKVYDPAGNTRVTANGLARELRKGGFEVVNRGMCCRTALGQVRLWAIRDAEKFEEMQGEEMGKLYNTERQLAPGARRKF